MVNNIEKRKSNIIKTLFIFNFIFLIISLYHISKPFTLTIIIINSISLLALIIIEKQGKVLDGLIPGGL